MTQVDVSIGSDIDRERGDEKLSSRTLDPG